MLGSKFDTSRASGIRDSYGCRSGLVDSPSSSDTKSRPSYRKSVKHLIYPDISNLVKTSLLNRGYKTNHAKRYDRYLDEKIDRVNQLMKIKTQKVDHGGSSVKNLENNQSSKNTVSRSLKRQTKLDSVLLLPIGDYLENCKANEIRQEEFENRCSCYQFKDSKQLRRDLEAKYRKEGDEDLWEGGFI